MVLSAGLDRIDLQSAAWFNRIEQVKQFVRDAGLEIVRSCSRRYGGSVLAYNRNLAEGVPVRDALFIARAARQGWQPTPPVTFVNPGFEEFTVIVRWVTGFTTGG